MDRVRAGKLGDPDHLLDRKVAFDRAHVVVQMRPAADLIALIRLEAVERQLVFFRPDCNCLDIQFVCSAKNANGDFGTVGDKNF